MHKNPIAILLTILALIIVIVFSTLSTKCTQNATTQDAIVGDYVITDDGAENVALQSDGGASQQTSLPAQKSLTAQQVVSDVIAAAQQNTAQDAPHTTFTQEEPTASPTPSATTVTVPQVVTPATSPATGPGAWATIIAAAGALAASMIGYKVVHAARVR